MKKYICLLLAGLLLTGILSGCCLSALPSYTCQECDESFIGQAMVYHNNFLDTTLYVCPQCYVELNELHGWGK